MFQLLQTALPLASTTEAARNVRSGGAMAMILLVLGLSALFVLTATAVLISRRRHRLLRENPGGGPAPQPGPDPWQLAGQRLGSDAADRRRGA